MKDDGMDVALDVDEAETWASLATVLEWLPAALDAQLQRDAGMTHFEFGVLYALAEAPDRALRMSVLAAYSRSTLSRLSRAVTRLERRGLMRREVDATDGRYMIASLTDAGHRAMAEALPGHHAFVRSVVLEPLTTAQTRHLRIIAGKIADAIEPDTRWRPRGGEGHAG